MEQAETQPQSASQTMRYRMLETLREFAQERLTPEEQQRLSHRHAHYFLTLAEMAKPHLTGPDPLVWADRLQAEHDNLRAAIGWFEQERSGSDSGSAAEAGALSGEPA